MLTVRLNGYGDANSNTGQGYLHFIYRLYPWERHEPSYHSSDG